MKNIKDFTWADMGIDLPKTIRRITLEMAKEIESNPNNPPNRKFRLATARLYCQTMLANNWIHNGEPLLFSTKGGLLDGMHRIKGQIMAGIDQSYTCICRIDTDTIPHGGVPMSRTVGDTLAMLGITGVSQLMITTAYMIRHHSKKVGLRGKLQRGTEVDFIQRHQKALAFADSCIDPKAGKAFRHGAIVAPIARAYYQGNHKRLLEFGKALAYGYNPDMSAEDSAAERLWKVISSNHGHNLGGQGDRDKMYRLTEAALDSFLNRKPVERLLKAETELFLLPEEKEFLETQPIRGIVLAPAMRRKLVGTYKPTRSKLEITGS